MPDLLNQTALVTGASRGIGRATALALARAGAHVLVHYGRSANEADSVVAEIEAGGGKATGIQGDLASPDGATAIAGQVRAIVGNRLDILVSQCRSQQGGASGGLHLGGFRQSVCHQCPRTLFPVATAGSTARRRLKHEDRGRARWITGASIPVDGGSKL